MERQQRQALSDARKSAARSALNGKKAATEEADERDDLQEIVGVGKVFEQALHELGIFKFSQIAAFDISDIARVNSKLKDFKGRMEQDDWIGQAKELHFKKYG
jgi:predicted flap endonuclease-1-like 5' DNA nuclease